MEAQSSDGLIWFLEGYLEAGGAVVRNRIRELPFRIGRRQGLDLSLSSAQVSLYHAEIVERDGELWVEDLASTNGTFVNCIRVSGGSPVRHGDILHFADLEFRLLSEQAVRPTPAVGTVVIDRLELPRTFAGQARELQELLDRSAVALHYQPIVDLGERKTTGFETLCRGASSKLPVGPSELFAIAAGLELAPELSHLCRMQVTSQAAEIAAGAHLFLNTHPTEMRDPPRLVDSLAELRERLPDASLVLEIHEAAVTDLAAMGALRHELGKLSMGLAYDDFGAGQARLVELVEVPPDYLKFDMSLIHGLGSGTEPKRKLLDRLVGMARDLGIPTVAEGVETPGEATACRQLGFDLAQGFHYGRPNRFPVLSSTA